MTDVAMIMGANRSEAEKQLHDVIELEIQLANVSCMKHISSAILRICEIKGSDLIFKNNLVYSLYL